MSEPIRPLARVPEIPLPGVHEPIRAGLLPLRAVAISVVREGRVLLDDLSLTLAGGSPTVIMGPNGAGKSLLLRVLNGLIAPSAGTIVWGEGVDPDVAGRRSALVFQRPTLLRRTVCENIAFVLRHRPRAGQRQTVGAVLAEAGLSHLSQTPARRLSGGEQQRLAIARALASLPEVLFLDEPTASLDPASTTIVERMIQSAAAGGAKIVLVTHNIGQAHRLAGEIVFLSQGRLLEQTPATEFFQKPRTRLAAAYLKGELWLNGPTEVAQPL